MYTSLSYVNAISDKYISSSVDCGYWNGYFGATLSLIDVNELLRLANYKPAARGRTQKKTVILFFFSSAHYPTFVKLLSRHWTIDCTYIYVCTYVRIHWHTEAAHIRCTYPSRLCIHYEFPHTWSCVFRLRNNARDSQRATPVSSRLENFGWPLYNSAAAVAAADPFTRSCTYSACMCVHPDLHCIVANGGDINTVTTCCTTPRN